jgi:prophage regulatory protein
MRAKATRGLIERLDMSTKRTESYAPVTPAPNQASTTIVALVFEQLPNGAYVREAQLVQSPSRPDSQAPLPFSAPTLWRKVKAGTFPKPIKLSERVTAWKVEHVRNWLAEQEAL